MNKMAKVALTLLITLGLVCSALPVALADGPQACSIYGYVTEAGTSTLINGAKVVLQVNGQTEYSGTDGYYQIAGGGPLFAPGTVYSLTASKDGYISQTKTFTFGGESQRQLDFQLTKIPPPTVQFSTAGGSVNEGGSVTITVTRSGDLSGTSTVALDTGGLPAGVTTGQTFPSTLTWGPGDNSPRTFTVNVATNSVIGDGGSATFTLSGPSGCTLGTSTYTLTINDMNTQSIASFQGSSATVNEGGLATITITRNGNTPATFDVTMTTTGDSGSLTAAAPATISFGASDTSKSFTVNVKTDSVVEGDRTVTFTLTDGGGATLGTQKTYTLTIHDINQPYNPSTPTPPPTPTQKDKITVHVHDGNDTPIVSASVTIGSQRLITDASGNATFLLDHGTPVNINVSATGYDAYDKPYTPNGDATVDVTLVLTPTPIPGGNGGIVTVTPTPTPTPEPSSSATENTSPNWLWLLLLLLIPLAGIVIYYNQYVKK